MRRGSLISILCLTFTLLLATFGAQSAAPETKAAAGAGSVTVLEINGAIGPATSRYIERGFEAAKARGSKLIVLKMDTPGGLDTSMRDIIRAILASTIPVASYVAPSGARAASAGTYIMYASHIAAMAPATNLGAATPVSIGAERPPERQAPDEDNDTDKKDDSSRPSPSDEKGALLSRPLSEGLVKSTAQGGVPSRPAIEGFLEPDAERSEAPSRPAIEGFSKSNVESPTAPRSLLSRLAIEGLFKSEVEKPSAQKPSEKPPAEPTKRSSREPGTAMERKVINDAVAYIRGLAELRGRNADWAESAVRSAESLSATSALSKGVIDLIARDIPDLLAQVDGRDIKLASGTIKLATRDLPIENIQPDWRTKLLSVITNPTIAYGLLLIGIYGLLFEGYNPGAILPGVVGAIALITALFAFQILSVNYAGLALIGLGVGMLIAEFFVPSFGALGIGGLTAFVVGSIILLDTDTPGLNIGLPVIAGVATVGGLVILGMGFMARRSMKRPVVTGEEAMIGATVEVVNDFNGKGTVRFGGEMWNAMSRVPLQKGQVARITRIEGLLLWVEPA